MKLKISFGILAFVLIIFIVLTIAQTTIEIAKINKEFNECNTELADNNSLCIKCSNSILIDDTFYKRYCWRYKT